MEMPPKGLKVGDARQLQYSHDHHNTHKLKHQNFKAMNCLRQEEKCSFTLVTEVSIVEPNLSFEQLLYLGNVFSKSLSSKKENPLLRVRRNEGVRN
jgi:hypothetical protein